MANQIIPVFKGTISSETTLLCDARDLHSFLAIGKVFAAWITSRLEEYGFIENQDYIVFSPDLAMVERNEKVDSRLQY